MITWELIYQPALIIGLWALVACVGWRTFFPPARPLMAEPSAQMPRPGDTRTWIGVLFIGGYYAVTVTLIFVDTPEKNGNLLNNMMLQLGPPVGMIIGALFRSDKVDETRADNTGKTADAQKATVDLAKEAMKQSGTANGNAAGAAADKVAGAATDKRDEIKGDT